MIIPDLKFNTFADLIARLEENPKLTRIFYIYCCSLIIKYASEKDKLLIIKGIRLILLYEENKIYRFSNFLLEIHRICRTGMSKQLSIAYYSLLSIRYGGLSKTEVATYPLSYLSNFNHKFKDSMRKYGSLLLAKVEKKDISDNDRYFLTKLSKKSVRKWTLDDIQTVLIILNDKEIIENLIETFIKQTESNYFDIIKFVYGSINNRLLLQTWIQKLELYDDRREESISHEKHQFS